MFKNLLQHIFAILIGKKKNSILELEGPSNLTQSFQNLAAHQNYPRSLSSTKAWDMPFEVWKKKCADEPGEWRLVSGKR